MRRFFVEKIEEKLVLKGEEHNHLSFVLRAKINDEIILCCGDGFDYTAKISSISKSETIVAVTKKEKNETEPKMKVTLFFAVLKGDKNDLVVQKATELGVYEMRPITTKFVSANTNSIKIERLNKIALESSKQCGRATLPKVAAVEELSSVLGKLQDFDTVLFLCEKQEFCKSDLKSYLEKRECGNVAVIIGSEGGFSDEEISALMTYAQPLSLGKRILRAETASISVLSILMYETGELK